MKESLFKLFPLLKIITSEDGLVPSDALGQKEANGNAAQRIIADLEVTDANLYDQWAVTISATTKEEMVVAAADKVTPDKFNLLEDLSELYSKSGVLGSALETLEKCRKTLEKMSTTDLAEELGWTFDKVYPKQKKSVEGSLTEFTNTLKVEVLFRLSSDALLEKVGIKNYFRGIRVDSIASVYGRQVNQGSSGLRKIMSARATKPGVEESLGTFKYLTTFKLAINKNAFNDKEGEITKIYNDHQRELNSILALIKDSARELNVKYTREYNEELKAYNDALVDFNAKLEIKREELLKELTSLKIKV